MKNVITKQTLLTNLMGLAAASLLAASPAAFAAGGTQQGAAGTATEQYEGAGTTTRDSGMSQDQQGMSNTQTQGMDNQDDQGLTGAQQDPQFEDQDEQGISGTQQDPQFEGQDEQGISATGTEAGADNQGFGQNLSSMSKDEIEDREITNLNGEEIGSVKEVVTEADGSISGVVVSVGGVLGMGAQEVFASAEEIQVNEDQLVWQTALDQDALSESQQYEAAGTTDE